MTFDLVEPVLVIGLGGAGSRLATGMKESLNADCLRISNDRKDLDKDDTIEISTKSIINHQFSSLEVALWSMVAKYLNLFLITKL